MTEVPKEIVVSRAASQTESAGRWILSRLRTGRWKRLSVGNRFRARGAAHGPSPVDSVGLHRVGAHFYQARLNHDLLGRFVDLNQHFPDIVDVAPSLAEENRIGAFVDLRWFFARELLRNQRRV